MAKQRLTVAARDLIKKHLRKSVYDVTARNARDELHDKLVAGLTAYFKVRYNKEDMEILKRYEVGEPTHIIVITGRRDNYRINLPEPHILPVYRGRYGDFNIVDSQLPATVRDIFDAYSLVCDKDAKCCLELFRKYSGIVDATKTWEELIDLIPEVAPLRPSNPNIALACIDGQTIREIKINTQERAEREAKLRKKGEK